MSRKGTQMTIRQQIKILHQFKTGEVPMKKFIDIAFSLGYPMFEWNGIVYLTPAKDTKFDFEKHRFGLYHELYGESSPVYQD